MVTVPVTVPSEPPLTVTEFTPPLLVTVTVTGAGEEVRPPKAKVAVVVMVPVVPSVTVLPAVLAANSQGLTVIVVGATMPGTVEVVTLKMHEPKLIVPVAVPVPDATEKAGVVVPAAGAENLTVVAAVVPNAGTPAGKVKPVVAAVKAAVATVAVVGEMVTLGTSANAIVAGVELPPPQATSAASIVKVNANLADVEPAIEK